MNKVDAEDVEPEHKLTGIKSTIPYCCQRAVLEDASEGWDHRRERNQIERLKESADTPKPHKEKGKQFLKVWQHCRNRHEDLVLNFTREEPDVRLDISTAIEHGM